MQTFVSKGDLALGRVLFKDRHKQNILKLRGLYISVWVFAGIYILQ